MSMLKDIIATVDARPDVKRITVEDGPRNITLDFSRRTVEGEPTVRSDIGRRAKVYIALRDPEFHHAELKETLRGLFPGIEHRGMHAGALTFAALSFREQIGTEVVVGTRTVTITDSDLFGLEGLENGQLVTDLGSDDPIVREIEVLLYHSEVLARADVGGSYLALSGPEQEERLSGPEREERERHLQLLARDNEKRPS